MSVAAIVLCTSAFAANSEPTFDMTFEAFRSALDEKIRDDTVDKKHPDVSTTNVCASIKNSHSCSFHDAGFQSSVAEFKKLDLMNGRFSLKLKLEIVTGTDAKVTAVTLKGDRADPVNLLQFVSTVENVLQIWDPAVGKEDDPKAVPEELGLMRGNSADDVGEPRTAIKPYAVVTCLTQDSDVTTAVVCCFVPRS